MDVTEPSMFCLDCGYPLDGLPEPRCPECGLAFDPEDMDTYSEDVGELLKLHQAHDRYEAHALYDLLKEHGIPATIMGDALRGGHGHDLPGTQPSVWIGEKYLERAEPVMKDFLDRSVPTVVVGGGDDPLEAAEPWTCPNCGEEIEPQFDACWNCAAGRPDVHQ